MLIGLPLQVHVVPVTDESTGADDGEPANAECDAEIVFGK